MTDDCYEFHRGDTALLISIPHDGRRLAPSQAERMTDVALDLPDTDWHVCKLYEFARSLGASIISANYSRYVVDLNRSSNDEVLYENQVATGLCPEKTFADEPVYVEGYSPTREERLVRIDEYWRPYHDRIREELDALRVRHGHALLWDAHSIPGAVPLLFDGQLPDLNIGTDDGASCRPDIQAAVVAAAESAPYSSILNGRFKGGFITRHYGSPAAGVSAIQLELAQRTYMDEAMGSYEPVKAEDLQKCLYSLLQTFSVSAAI